MKFLQKVYEAQPSTVVLIAVLLFLSIFLIVAHIKSRTFSLLDLICVEGKVDLEKFGTLLAILVSTWGFVVLILTDKMSEWYFFAYMVSWAGLKLLSAGKLTLNQAQKDSQ